MHAYAQKCSVCGLQLRIVEAAHIVPVVHPMSLDLVTNGICLCANHHKAFDRGVFYLYPDYRIGLNHVVVDQLRREELFHGGDQFLSDLPHMITVPREQLHRPNPDFIEIRNQYFQIEA